MKTNERIAFADLDAEKEVIALLCNYPSYIKEVQKIITTDVFNFNATKNVYLTCVELFSEQGTFSLSDVILRLKTKNNNDWAVVMSATTSRNPLNGNELILYLAELKGKRDLLNLSREINNDLANGADYFELVDKINKVNNKELIKEDSNEILDMKSALLEAVNTIGDVMTNGTLSGVPTGYPKLDDITGGWLKGNVILFAARPGQGKCFAKGTKIRMFDGSIKNVEDIKNGEYVMGDDSTSRKVFGCTSGREKMYQIKTNKGDGFVCNESHILSLIYNKDGINAKYGWTKNSIVNISVKDYLKLSDWEKKRLKLYTKGYGDNFQENKHDIPPYLLGVFLGDGTSLNGDITSVDKEIINYYREYANSIGCSMVNADSITYRINKIKGHVKNKYKQFLRDIFVLGNKHIPKQYLIDSRKNRLELLSGLIDTDGSLNIVRGNYDSYEITQKRENLAYDILELSRSLGFYTSLNKRKSKMKRNDGSIYECVTYRVKIYGDLSIIPCKIERKKCPYVKRRVDSSRIGFNIIEQCEDEYYGFAVDKNHLFLLENGLVVHNTIALLEHTRWAAQMGQRVLFLSLEMPVISLVFRMISGQLDSGLPYSKIKTGRISIDQFNDIQRQAVTNLENLPITWYDGANRDINYLTNLIQKIVREKKIDMVVIDYIQLMSDSTIRTSNETEIVGSVADKIQLLSKKLNIPFLCAAQLNRSNEARASHRPRLSDLRSSGKLEQSASVVIGLHREDYYAYEKAKEEGDANFEFTNKIEYIFCKNRDGDTRTADMYIDVATSKIRELDPITNKPSGF
jgi:replicative DNA helicase